MCACACGGGGNGKATAAAVCGQGRGLFRMTRAAAPSLFSRCFLSSRDLLEAPPSRPELLPSGVFSSRSSFAAASSAASLSLRYLRGHEKRRESAHGHGNGDKSVRRGVAPRSRPLGGF